MFLIFQFILGVLLGATQTSYLRFTLRQGMKGGECYAPPSHHDPDAGRGSVIDRQHRPIV